MIRVVIAPTGTTNEYSGPDLTSKKRKLFDEPKLPKTPSDGKQNVTVNGSGSFRKKPFAERLSEKVVSLISDSRRKDTINHYELPWRKWDIWC